MLKNKIAYIIGHRDCETRTRNLLLVLRWLTDLQESCYQNYDIELQIVVVEQDSRPKLNISDFIVDGEHILHLFIYNPGFYNRGWAFNVGVRNVYADYYFFADNDILLRAKDMLYVFRKCFLYEAVNPYKHIYDSTNEYVTSSLNPLCFDDADYISQFPARQDTCFSGGIVGVSRKGIYVISGWDERFRGRGWEDYAFTAKLKLFLYSSCTFTFNALHLWHEWETNTTRDINRELNAQYETYVVDDYFDCIRRTRDTFGSALKYAYTGDMGIFMPVLFRRGEFSGAISTNRYCMAKNEYCYYSNKVSCDCRYVPCPHYRKKIFQMLCGLYKHRRTCTDTPDSGGGSSEECDNNTNTPNNNTNNTTNTTNTTNNVKKTKKKEQPAV